MNPSRLGLARKRRGLTLTALAEQTGISRVSLSTYENGRVEPSPSTMATLASALNVSETFLTGDELDDIPLDAVSFRALSKMTARTRDRGLSSGRIAILIDQWIGERFNRPAADIPTLTERPPSLAAEELRARWGLGQKPLGNLIHLLEAHGVRVYSLNDENTDLDAFCLRWNGQPFVFLSQAKSAERIRFNAAHELGHLVMHSEDQSLHGPEAEREANQFAASFLMPEADVLAQGLSNPSLQRVLTVKKRWNVAAMALTHRINELGLTSEWVYRSLCVDLSRRGYRRGEPHGMPHEASQLLTKVMQQLRSDRRGFATIANDVGIDPAEVKAYMLGLTPTAIEGAAQANGVARANLHIVSDRST